MYQRHSKHNMVPAVIRYEQYEGLTIEFNCLIQRYSPVLNLIGLVEHMNVQVSALLYPGNV